MSGLGMSELCIILVIVFIIFGAGKLPDLGPGVGKAISNFKGETSKTEHETPDNKSPD